MPKPPVINEADSSQVASRRIAMAVARMLTATIGKSVVVDSSNFIVAFSEVLIGVRYYV